jgi:hypothetical protein
VPQREDRQRLLLKLASGGEMVLDRLADIGR